MVTWFSASILPLFFFGFWSHRYTGHQIFHRTLTFLPNHVFSYWFFFINKFEYNRPVPKVVNDIVLFPTKTIPGSPSKITILSVDLCLFRCVRFRNCRIRELRWCLKLGLSWMGWLSKVQKIITYLPILRMWCNKCWWNIFERIWIWGI